MVSRRKILSRSRDDLNLEHQYVQQEEEEDIWYQKDKLYKVSVSRELRPLRRTAETIYARARNEKGEKNTKNTKVKLIGTCEVLRTMEMSLLCFPLRLVAGEQCNSSQENDEKIRTHSLIALVFEQTKKEKLNKLINMRKKNAIQ